ncbi:hypothetical protein ACFQAT_26400 [Undibacterium arcticum]
MRADAPDGEMFEQQLADVEARYADSCSGSRSKMAVLALDADFGSN